jgi:DNA-directed RNA polymerase subunit RPC12/RpoP
MEEYKHYDDYREIKCPHCNKHNSIDPEYTEIITYWGDNSTQEYECNDCGEKYYIDEYVDRWWIVKAKD